MANLDRVLRVRYIYQTETFDIVGLVHNIAMDIQVMVNGTRGAEILTGQDWILQIADVKDQCTRSLYQLGSLISLVIKIEITMVFGKPALVSIGYIGLLCD